MANRAAIELAAALGVGAISVFGVVEASRYHGASSYMPLAVTGLSVALAGVWAVQSALALARGRGAYFTIPAPVMVRFAIVVAAVVLYVVGIGSVGFFTSTVVMVPGLAMLIGYRNVPVALIATAGFCAVLYGVFRLLLAVPLPPERLFQAMGL